ncbi:hypothetical protein D1831_09310 [Lactiplantibacillus garii]|uniref:Uncharacterized protein n=1 Tax=Lactiplantibacillus garii TaxID=2306423 RepID=A0A3R8KDY5_9LACO|nr:hypothetical protein [Lactiplantibacillus garii]RRK10076.1 hypothetical protein D1831_09310 [Lactiplantibacillus garii]
MTKSWSLFKAFSWPRFIRMNWIVAFELLILVVSNIWTAFQGDFTSYALFRQVSSLMFVMTFIGLVMLAVYNERTVTAPTYRLIPIHEWKFYVVNVAASLINLLYLWAIQLILYVLTLSVSFNHFPAQASGLVFGISHSDGLKNLTIFWTLMTVMGLLGILVAWSTISLVHYVTKSAGSFLPRFRQKFVNTIIYLVGVLITVRLVNILMGAIGYLSSRFFSTTELSSVWLGAGVMVAILIVETAINLGVLTKWGEPNSN